MFASTVVNDTLKVSRIIHSFLSTVALSPQEQLGLLGPLFSVLTLEVDQSPPTHLVIGYSQNV